MVLCFGDGRQAPCLRDWLPRESLARIHRRCEALVHESMYGGAEEGGADGALGALQFSRRGAAFLLAESAELTAAASMADPSDSDQQFDDPDLTVIMELHGVSKLRMPWQGGRPRVSRSLRPIDESPMDAADDGDVTG